MALLFGRIAQGIAQPLYVQTEEKLIAMGDKCF
jgi:hypothetical protein